MWQTKFSNFLYEILKSKLHKTLILFACFYYDNSTQLHFENLAVKRYNLSSFLFHYLLHQQKEAPQFIASCNIIKK